MERVRRKYPQLYSMMITLAQFGAPCEFLTPIYQHGSVMYPVLPRSHVKVSQIHALQKELAQAAGCRPLSRLIIHDVIEGGSMGIEILIDRNETLQLSRLPALSKKHYPRLQFGIDSRGKPVAIDLSAVPDLLIGGLKGKGKSNLIFILLLQLLETYRPDQLRLLLIDPKNEFSAFAGLPHLLAPICSDMDNAADIYQWLIEEMERRSAVFKAAGGYPNLWEYNADRKPAERMPTVICVCDEAGDLFATHQKTVETPIRRLAMKARAAGIHMILATQKPDAGTIPANIRDLIAARFAFAVIGRHASEAILGTGRTEAASLSGRGVGYLYSDSGELIRTYVPHIETAELQRRLQVLSGRQSFVPELAPEETPPEPEPVSLLDRARIVCLQYRAEGVTAQTLQDALSIGYREATDILAALEKSAVVGKPRSQGKRRRVLLSAGEQMTGGVKIQNH